MKFKRFTIISIFLSLAIGGWVAVSHWSTESHQAEKIVIAVSKTPLSAPFYVAAEKELFDKDCIQVEIMDVIGGPASFRQVVSGRADFGTSSDSVLVFKGLVRDDFVNLATFVQSDNDIKLIGLESHGFSSSKDLVGKRIGLTQAAAGEYFLSIYLAMNGITLDDIQRVYMTPDKLPNALAEGEVDIISSWEPFGYQSVQLLAGDAKVLETRNLYTLTFNLIATKQRVQHKSHATSCVVEGLYKATEFIASYPEQTQQILLDRLKLDQAFIDWIWQDYIFRLSLDQSLLMTLEAQAKWAIDSGLVDTQEMPEFKHMLEDKWLKEIDPLLVTLD